MGGLHHRRRPASSCSIFVFFVTGRIGGLVADRRLYDLVYLKNTNNTQPRYI